MLRFINSNRLAAIGLAAAIALVLATILSRLGAADSESRDEEATQGPTEATATPIDAVREGNAAAQPAPSSASAVPSADDPTRLSIPIDPSGSRSDRSEDGARQSAIDFAGVVQQRLLYLSESAATDLLVAWSHDAIHVDQVVQNVEQVANLRQTLTSGGGDVWWSVTPIASRVEAVDDARARVSVWVVQIVGSDVDPQLGGDAVAPTVDFRTTVVDLVWNDARSWSVWNTSSMSGPMPMVSATSTMSAPTEFMDALGDFTLTKEHS